MASASWTFGNLRPDEKGLKPMPSEGSAVPAVSGFSLSTLSMGSKLALASLLTALVTTAIVAPVAVAAMGGFDPTEDKKCISVANIDAAQTAWAGALVAIGNAWNNENCTGALREANGALDAAYTFQYPLFFKPTLAADSYTFRRTRDEALSYFVGACSGDAHIASDNGFALGYSAGDANDQSTWKGFSSATFVNMTYRTGGKFCDMAIAQGKLSYYAPYSSLTYVVDKTFVYVKNPTDGGIPLITVHHSSN